MKDPDEKQVQGLSWRKHGTRAQIKESLSRAYVWACSSLARSHELSDWV